ncbi:MAG: helix-turn-helix domain-containing protein [Verrucomicrobiales bacterium]
MKPVVLVQADSLQPFVRCLVRRGINPEPYLERQRIAPKQVTSGKGVILRSQAYGFFKDVSRRESMPTLGFLDHDPFTIDDLGSLGGLLEQAATLKDAIDTFAALIHSFVQANTVYLEQGPEISWLCIRGEGMDPEAHAGDHFTPFVLAEIIRLAAGPQWRPEGLRFQFGPAEMMQRSAFSGDIECHHFRHGSGVAFRSELLASPLQKRAKRAQGGEPPSAPAPLPLESTSEVLEVFVASHLKHGTPPSSDEAADLLNIHRSTLSRALRSEGLTWRRLVDRARLGQARQRLTQTTESVKEIAYSLGYTEPGNFIRAFKRLTGSTPEAFRRDSSE